MGLGPNSKWTIPRKIDNHHWLSMDEIWDTKGAHWSLYWCICTNIGAALLYLEISLSLQKKHVMFLINLSILAQTRKGKTTPGIMMHGAAYAYRYSYILCYVDPNILFTTTNRVKSLFSLFMLPDESHPIYCVMLLYCCYYNVTAVDVIVYRGLCV